MKNTNQKIFKVVVHGSFGQHFEQIRQAIKIFEGAHITIIAPESREITAIKGSFLLLENEENLNPIAVELAYLHKLQQLGVYGFSYFVNPSGYIGKSAAYELGIAQATGVPCYFSHRPKDLPVYAPGSHIISPNSMVKYIATNNDLPNITKRQSTTKLHKMFQRLIGPGSVVATGAIIQHQAKPSSLPEILLVKTHKWGNRFSIVGGKVRHGERLHEALRREIKEETGLSAEINDHITTFDQLKHSGYYQDYTHHMFVDYVVSVDSKQVRLNEEAQEYLWAPAEQALAELNIEPNAAYTINQYLLTQ
jgi:ADP-ribose pyrophosphatase YjhB (NUDIX family)